MKKILLLLVAVLSLVIFLMIHPLEPTQRVWTNLKVHETGSWYLEVVATRPLPQADSQRKEIANAMVVEVVTEATAWFREHKNEWHTNLTMWSEMKNEAAPLPEWLKFAEVIGLKGKQQLVIRRGYWLVAVQTAQKK